MSEVTDGPARVRLAVALSTVGPGDRVLEVGGGPRTAAPALLEAGASAVHLLDRSATALVRARARTGDDPRVTSEQAALAGCTAADAAFDVALAVNVNVFWTSTADAETATLRRVLAAGGRFVLVFGGPADGDARGVVPTVRDHLERGGLAVEVVDDEPGLVGFVCRAAARG